MAYNGYSTEVFAEDTFTEGTCTTYAILECGNPIGTYRLWDRDANVLSTFIFRSDDIRDEFFEYAYETFHRDTGEESDECAYLLMDALIKN